jgi:hypothetical protein
MPVATRTKRSKTARSQGIDSLAQEVPASQQVPQAKPRQPKKLPHQPKTPTQINSQSSHLLTPDSTGRSGRDRNGGGGGAAAAATAAPAARAEELYDWDKDGVELDE